MSKVIIPFLYMIEIFQKAFKKKYSFRREHYCKFKEKARARAPLPTVKHYCLEGRGFLFYPHTWIKAVK